MKNKDYKDYKEIFDREMNSGRKIYTQDKTEELIIEDNEKWKQCYKPEDKIREQLPPFWFISDRGNLISVAKGKAYWLKKEDFNNSGRYSYHCNICIDSETSVNKNIELHNLVRIVFGGLSYGKADELLQQQGIFAFGVKNSQQIKLNGHHIGDKADNSPDNIELITTEAHKIIDKTPKKTDPETIHKFLAELGKMAEQEEPDKFTLLLTGQKIDKDTLEIIEDNGYRVLLGTNKIILSRNAVDQMITLQKNIKNAWLIDEVTKALCKTYGLEYFVVPKYLCTTDYSFYKCEKVADELHITEVTDVNELVNKSFIMCNLNKDRQAEYLIDKE